MRVVLFLLLFSVTAYTNSIKQKYPSYHYVFGEFGVEPSYVDDAYFQYFVKRYENKLEGFYRRSLKRGEKILPMIKGNLAKGGMSDLFLYLSMIESGFNPGIVSHKKAAGLWQFMPETAKDYKLSVYKGYDERYDPKSSTAAAVKYLTKLYRQFGKWYLAAMAYNCGEGRLERAIAKAGTDNIHTLLDERAKYLPKETRNYIRKILLVAMIGEAGHLEYRDAPLLDIEVPVIEGTLLEFVAKIIETPIQELRALNPAFHSSKSKTLIIPEDKVVAFYLRYDKSVHASQNFPKKQTVVVNNANSYVLTHSVKMGETLYSIAQKYNTTVEEIHRVNHRGDGVSILLGTLLVVPVSEVVFKHYLNTLEE